jgi:hypothetical protein
MRALPILALAAFTLFASPAWAILEGSTSRDPNGLRRSVVSIENSLGELCSGVIVGPDLVLTAAHCVIDRAAYRVIALNRALRPQRFNVAALAIHPTFVPGTTPWSNSTAPSAPTSWPSTRPRRAGSMWATR